MTRAAVARVGRAASGAAGDCGAAPSVAGRVTLGGVLAASALVAALVGFAAFSVGPRWIERSANTVQAAAAKPPTTDARRLHESLFVADLHADSLLWGRDLLVRGSVGHVDVPRLVEGGVALQVFSAVTRSPRGQNYDQNASDAADNVTLLAVLERWPTSTWGSLEQRALYQAAALHRAAERSAGRLRVIETAEQLRRFVADHRADPHTVAGVLAIEGLHCLEGNLDHLEDLRAAGYRMMGLTHFFDNELGGSAHGMTHGGLTEFGRQAVRRMQERDVIVDLAHASARVIDETLAISTKPVVVSHTGLKGTCDHVRNLSDDQLRGVAATGGVVGIGYWDAAVCEVSVAGIVRAIRYAAQVVGADHVALGSDFDGGTDTPFDASGIPLLTQGLLDAGFSADDVRKIMGGNVERVLERSLPH